MMGSSRASRRVVGDCGVIVAGVGESLELIAVDHVFRLRWRVEVGPA